jgi:wyosine [tRNA(Phe)-imidazoG37] synthetase (radical SAM superfamily)
LAKENMPLHSEVREFSEKLSELTGYPVRDEQKESRVVLLSK